MLTALLREESLREGAAGADERDRERSGASTERTRINRKEEEDDKGCGPHLSLGEELGSRLACVARMGRLGLVARAERKEGRKKKREWVEEKEREAGLCRFDMAREVLGFKKW